jgi:hypothetical protein
MPGRAGLLQLMQLAGHQGLDCCMSQCCMDTGCAGSALRHWVKLHQAQNMFTLSNAHCNYRRAQAETAVHCFAYFRASTTKSKTTAWSCPTHHEGALALALCAPVFKLCCLTSVLSPSPVPKVPKVPIRARPAGLQIPVDDVLDGLVLVDKLVVTRQSPGAAASPPPARPKPKHTMPCAPRPPTPAPGAPPAGAGTTAAAPAEAPGARCRFRKRPERLANAMLVEALWQLHPLVGVQLLQQVLHAQADLLALLVVHGPLPLNRKLKPVKQCQAISIVLRLKWQHQLSITVAHASLTVGCRRVVHDASSRFQLHTPQMDVLSESCSRHATCQAFTKAPSTKAPTAQLFCCLTGS